MLQRFILLLIILQSFNQTSNAQYYKYLTNNNEYAHSAWDAVELGDNSLVLPLARWNPQLWEFLQVIYKFDEFGYIIDSLILKHTDYYYNVIWVKRLGNDLLFAGGAVDKLDYEYDVILIKTDTLLNVIWDTIFGSTDNDFVQSLYVSSDNEFYLSIVQDTDTFDHFMIYHFNPLGQVEDIISKNCSVQLRSEIIESPAKDKLFVSLLNENRIWVISRNDFVIDTIIKYSLPDLGRPAACLANLNDSNFMEIVYASKWGPPQSPFIPQLCFQRRNMKGVEVDYFRINPSLNDGEMIYNDCIHAMSNDSILILSTRGPKIYGHSYFEYDQDSWFSLYNISMDGTINWHKLYGGEAFYRATRLLPSKCGGYYIIGLYYDWRQFSTYNEQLLIYKVDRNGDFLTSVENQEPKNNLIRIYPNPVSDILSIEIDVDVEIEQLRVIDIQGRILYETIPKAPGGTIHISMSEFNSGLYVIQLIDNNNFAFNKRIIVNQ